MTRKNRINLTVLFISIILLISLLYICVSWLPLKARRAWKDVAISDISRLAIDKKWIAEQISRFVPVDNAQTIDNEGWWVSGELILMKNKEWLIYKNHCSKRAPHNVSDIFIAKGSDGNWYYSTYHFCIDMFVLKHMHEYGQPENLKTFISQYSLKQFDGKSDECLQKTWPQ